MSDWTPPGEGGPAAGTATPGSGKCVYTEDFLRAFEKGPQCQRAPADLEAPDDVDYWPLIGFTPPPGMMGGGGRRGGRGGPQWNGPPGGGGRGGRGGRGGDDRWGHKGLPPDQQGGGRRGAGAGRLWQLRRPRQQPPRPEAAPAAADGEQVRRDR